MVSDKDKKILVIDFCNYEDYQIGGHLSMAKNLISAFGNDLVLVGVTTNKNEPVGRWFKKQINGIDFNYFALARYDKSKTKHVIPDRLVSFLLVKYFKLKILRIGAKNTFIQRHEIMAAVKNFKLTNICYCFPGLESPLKISKYWFSKYMAEQFDKAFFKGLKTANLILASGDEKSIDEMIERSHNAILRNNVIKFPTRINTNIFKPLNRLNARKNLNIPEDRTIITTTGRLAWYKGWKFMIDCFIFFEKTVPNSYFYIIGTGEDLQKIKEYLIFNHISDKVCLTGGKNSDEISLYLNSSDLFIMGSYKEGWSTSLSEAVACGIPSCVTDFSSAKDIIQEAINGYVISNHNEESFVKGMLKAIKIPRPVFNDNVKRYSTDKLKDDLLNLWRLV